MHLVQKIDCIQSFSFRNNLIFKLLVPSFVYLRQSQGFPAEIVVYPQRWWTKALHLFVKVVNKSTHWKIYSTNWSECFRSKMKRRIWINDDICNDIWTIIAREIKQRIKRSDWWRDCNTSDVLGDCGWLSYDVRIDNNCMASHVGFTLLRRPSWRKCRIWQNVVTFCILQNRYREIVFTHW